MTGLVSTFAAGQVASTETASSDSQSIPSSRKDMQGVITLDTMSFDKSIRDGNIWLVEFYANWCGHCKKFAHSYATLALDIHERTENIRIAKVDGDVERAISSRFNIEGYPTFYLIDGWSVYVYKGHRQIHPMAEFVKGGYKDTEVRSLACL